MTHSSLFVPTCPPWEFKLLKSSRSKLTVKACICAVPSLVRLPRGRLHKAAEVGGGEGSFLVCLMESLHLSGELFLNELTREKEAGSVLGEEGDK